MTVKKFTKEVDTLNRFFSYYCKNKHKNQELKDVKLTYKDTTLDIQLDLCPECFDTINYSFARLQGCPHEIKPRCRKCPNPCYERKQWKDLAKIMKYSAINLGLSKMKQKIKKLFTN